MEKTDKREPEFVEALARGLAVIESFDAAHSDMTLSEVARRTGMTPAAARRSLHTLAGLGYVRHVNKKFMLSARILTLGSAYLRAARVDEVLLPALTRIVRQFGDAASVTVLHGLDILYVAHYSEQRAGRMVAGFGVTYPAYATSMGRVLLGGLSAEDLDTYFGRASFKPLTELTVTDPALLRERIAEARIQGYATAVDELDYGITALAVPIKDGAGRVVAALNSSGYTGRLKIAEMIVERLSALREAAALLSAALRQYPSLSYSLAGSGVNKLPASSWKPAD